MERDNEILGLAFKYFNPNVEDGCTCWNCQKDALNDMMQHINNVLLDPQNFRG